MSGKKRVLYASGAAVATVAVAGLLVVRMFWPSPCAATGVARGYEAKKSAPSAEDLAPAMLDGAFYNDRYTLESYFPDGTTLYTSAFVTNFGMGDGKLKFKSSVKQKGQKDRRGGDKEQKKGEWSFTRGPFSLEADGQKISGTPERLEVEGSGEGYRFHLVYEATVPPWRPGGGRVVFGSKDHFVDTSILQPKSRVTGWLEVDGERRELEGYGWAMRTYGTVAPHDLATRQLDVRAVDSDTVLYLRHFKVPESSGGAEMGYVLVAKAGKVLFESTDFEVQYGDLRTDEEHENKYEVPEKLVIRDTSDGKSLTLGVVAQKRTRRDDKTKSLSRVERAIVGKFAKPVQYDYRAAFELKIEGGLSHTAKGRAVYEFHHINKE